MNYRNENPAGGETMPGYQTQKKDILMLHLSSKKSRLNRRKAIRLRCLDCSGFSIKEARDCKLSDCPLHGFRMAIGKQNPTKRDQAIRQYCLDCMDGSKNEVRLCPSKDCPLYAFRNTAAPRRKAKKTAYTGIFSNENEKGIQTMARR